MKKVSYCLLFAFITLLASCQKEVTPPVLADFDYNETQGGKVLFRNNSQNSDSYEWDFNTGDNSSEIAPTYTFRKNKDYLVTLTAKGKAGQNSKSKTLRITTGPTTGSVIFWSTIPTGIKMYVNDVYRGVNTSYQLVATAPACDENGFVTVSLPEGAYRFTGIEDRPSNQRRWSGTFSIENGRCLAFRLTL